MHNFKTRRLSNDKIIIKDERYCRNEIDKKINFIVTQGSVYSRSLTLGSYYNLPPCVESTHEWEEDNLKISTKCSCPQFFSRRSVEGGHTDDRLWNRPQSDWGWRLVIGDWDNIDELCTSITIHFYGSYVYWSCVIPMLYTREVSSTVRWLEPD